MLVSSTPSPVGRKITWLLCPKCGWNIEMVGMKPECPICREPLHWVYGTKEEIVERLRKPEPNWDKAAECPGD